MQITLIVRESNGEQGKARLQDKVQFKGLNKVVLPIVLYLSWTCFVFSSWFYTNTTGINLITVELCDRLQIHAFFIRTTRLKFAQNIFCFVTMATAANYVMIVTIQIN